MRGFLALSILCLFGFVLAGCGNSSASDKAAVINGHDVPMHQYDVAFKTERQREIDSVGYDPCGAKNPGPACSVIKQQAFQAVIQQELIREYANAHHISLPQSDINRQWNLVVRQKFGNNQYALRAWLARLHESPQDLRSSIAADLLQQKVLYAITASVPSVSPAIRLAVIQARNSALSFVRQRLHTGMDFLSLATFLKSSPTSGCKQLKCGELGWAPTLLVPANRSKLLTARVGSLVGPYQGQQIFELYKVQARVQGYVLTPQQQYQLRVTRFAAWMDAQQSHAKVTRYVAV